ncbi:MAG: SprB repeat-containing protein, partial [bacterium]
MKAIYKHGMLMKLLKIPAMVFLTLFLLAVSYTATAQTSSPANPICQGVSIQLNCTGQGGCDVPGAIYSWTATDPNWNTGGTYNIANPLVTESDVYGYKTQVFYLSIQYVEGGITKFSGSSVAVQVANIITISETVTNTTCFGGGGGAISTAISGGTPFFPGPPFYTFSWSPGGQTTQSISSLVAGTYTIVVTDRNSCTGSKSIVVGSPAAVGTSSANITHVGCNGGATGGINITPSGGTAGYSYLWSPGGATTEDIAGKLAGTYSVLITDSKGCTGTYSGTITEPSGMTLTGTGSSVNCFGTSGGTVTTTVSGGAFPYTYQWSTPATTQNLTGLAAGDYCVTVSDNNGCSKTGCWTVSTPALLVLSKTAVDITCFGLANGSIDLSVAGGTTNYTYHWNNNATTQDLNGLSQGAYTVTVTDSHGCSNTTSQSITQPSQITQTATVTHMKCANIDDGAIDVSVTGGTGSYTYQWSYNSATTQDLTGLHFGSYTLQVTDSRNCSATATWVVTSPATPPSFISVVHHVNCNGETGYITTTPTGGTPGYTYSWSPDGQTTQNISGLYPGTYVLILTDSKGCTASSSRELTQPAALVAGLVSKTDINCNSGNNGAIDVSVTGGTVGYTYHWSNNATTQDLGSLTAAAYNLTVTDSHGCTATFTTTLTQPSTLTQTATVTHMKCANIDDGAIDVSVT